MLQRGLYERQVDRRTSFRINWPLDAQKLQSAKIEWTHSPGYALVVLIVDGGGEKCVAAGLQIGGLGDVQINAIVTAPNSGAWGFRPHATSSRSRSFT